MNDTLLIKINIIDTFIEYNNSSFKISIKNGLFSISEKDGFDCQITVDIANLSSLFINAVSIYDLYNYGLLTIDKPEFLERLYQLFSYFQKPMCLTQF